MHIETNSPGQLPWAPQWYDRVHDPANATPIIIARPGEVLALPVVLERGATISGTVLDQADGAERYFMYVMRADRRQRWGYAFGQPEFAIRGMSDGDWKLGAWRRFPTAGFPDEPPPDTVWYPGTTDWSAAEILRIRGSQDITGLEIRMESPEP